MRKNKSFKYFFFSIIILILLNNSLLVSYGNEEINNSNPKTSGYYYNVPHGTIVMWNGLLDNIPEGWSLCNGSNGTPDLMNKALLCIDNEEDPGETGGSDTHSHVYEDLPKHNHLINDPGHSHLFSQWDGGSTAQIDQHDWPWETEVSLADNQWQGFESPTSISLTGITIQGSGIDNCETDSTISLPPYYKTVYIMKTGDSKTFPKNSILIWSGSDDNIPPDGWEYCDGRDGRPGLNGRFTLGVSNGEEAGSYGGSELHSHSYSDLPIHKHIVQDPGHMHYSNKWNGAGHGDINYHSEGNTGYDNAYSQVKSLNSQSGITILDAGTTECKTEDASSLPPYIKLSYLIKISDDTFIPKGMISVWSNLTESIPEGWNFCNGLNGMTPDITDCFILGTDIDLEYGLKGGTRSHSHTYAELQKHNHTINDLGHSHTFANVLGDGSGVERYNTIMAGTNWDVADNTQESFSFTNEDVGLSLIDEGITNCITRPESNIPPYYKVAFIMNNEDPIPLPINNDNGDNEDDGDNEDNGDNGENLSESTIILLVSIGVISSASTITGVSIIRNKKNKKNNKKLIKELIK